jgi:hypothetical protein
MKTVDKRIALREKISYLQKNQSYDLQILKNQYKETIESFEPLNLIKSSFQEVISSPNLKSNLINGVVGLGTNYLTKGFLNQNSTNPIKSIVGKVLKFALKNLIKKK